jgi:2-hydroxychromene-2-carboxylate isomerase
MASSGSDGDALTFFFDFASPYAYFAFDRVIALAGEFGLSLRLRPALVWAILKEQGIPPPLDSPARDAYFRADMPRSAAFHGVAYNHPPDMPISAHLAARLWLGHPEALQPHLARAIFQARFVDGRDIRDRDMLASLAAVSGTERDDARAMMDADKSRQQLAENITAAVKAGAPGIPFLTWRGEGFFGADRLPQLRWRIERSLT